MTFIENLLLKIKTNLIYYELFSFNFNGHTDMVGSVFTMSNKKRRAEWGKGWDGRSRIPDETFKKNYNEIDWSYVNKTEVITPEEYETNLLKKEHDIK